MKASAFACPQAVSRRSVLRSAAAAAAVSLAGVARSADPPAAPAAYRAAVIGHTGRGNYGHGLDVVWLNIPNVKVVAVADADAKGLAAAAKRLGGAAPYPDYRQMLQKEKPDLVSICPRHLDQHRDIALAACQAGVRGIYLEKPMCRTLEEADQVVAACEQHKVKLAVSHQTRYCPRVAMAKKLIDEGVIGKVLDLRARGKEDRRGGGEDLWVLGTHVLNLVQFIGGQPLWGFAEVRQDGKPVTREHVHEGAEGIGPLAGDEVHAVWRLASGAMASFDSVKNAQPKEARYVLFVCGTKGVIRIGHGYMTQVHLLEDASWAGIDPKAKWRPISSAGVDQPEPVKTGGMHGGNETAVRELIACVEKGGNPSSSVYDGRWAMEMIVSVFESHRLGRPVKLPLETRKNPLTML